MQILASINQALLSVILVLINPDSVFKRKFLGFLNGTKNSFKTHLQTGSFYSHLNVASKNFSIILTRPILRFIFESAFLWRKLVKKKQHIRRQSFSPLSLVGKKTRRVWRPFPLRDLAPWPPKVSLFWEYFRTGLFFCCLKLPES